MRTIIPVNRPSYPLHLIEYGDFSCPRCRELQQLLTTTLPQFGDHVHYVFRHFPKSGNPLALLMALAAEAARRQGQYGAMHRALFAHTTLIPVSLGSVLALAVTMGLDQTTFLNDLNDATLKQGILTNVGQAKRADVVATPTLFLGNRRLHGKLTQARLVPLIRYYIERSRAPLPDRVDNPNELVRWSGVGHHEPAQVIPMQSA